MIQRHHPSRLFALVALLLAGCGGPSAAPQPPLAEGPKPQASSAPEPALPTASAAPIAPKDAQKTAPESPFTAVARVDVPERTAGLRVVGVGSAGFILGMSRLIKIEDKGLLLRDGSLDKGLPGNWLSFIADLTGRWPDALWANVVATNGRVGAGELYRWSGDGWRSLAAQLTPAWVYVGISPWSDGRTLALTRNTLAFGPRPEVRFAVVNGPPAKVPEFTPVKPSPAPTKNGMPPCHLSLDPVAFVALPSGHVFTAGHPCDDLGHIVVEWWAPGKTKSTVETLTPEFAGKSPYEDEPVFYARSGEDVYLAGGPTTKGPVLYHFDGRAWKSVKVPVQSAISAVSGLPDGTIYLAAADTRQVLRLAPDGAWTTMDLPPSQGEKRSSLTGVWARTADEVWVTTAEAVLRTGAPPGGAVEVLKADEQAPPQGGKKPALVRPATPTCKTVFALLYTLARTAPDDFDFPQTRAALKGQTAFKDATFVETEDRGRRYFGASVPSYEMGKELVKVMSNKVPGASPQLLCVEPKVRRIIKIDLRTGDLVK